MAEETKFISLPAELYPFTIRAFDASGAEVWTETIEGPGALYMPPLIDTYGPVTTRVEFADGSVEDGEP